MRKTCVSEKKKNHNITLSYLSRISDLMYQVNTWDILWCGSSSDFDGLLHLLFTLVSLGNSRVGSFHKGGRRKLEVGAITMLSFPQTRLTNSLRLQGGITVLPTMSNLITMSARHPFSLLNLRRWGRCVFFIGVLHHNWAFFRTE